MPSPCCIQGQEEDPPWNLTNIVLVRCDLPLWHIKTQRIYRLITDMGLPFRIGVEEPIGHTRFVNKKWSLRCRVFVVCYMGLD